MRLVSGKEEVGGLRVCGTVVVNGGILKVTGFVHSLVRYKVIAKPKGNTQTISIYIREVTTCSGWKVCVRCLLG